MIIQHIGHAEFLLELEDGTRIVTDPYDDSCGYPVPHLTADAALVSHGHFDHNAVKNLAGNPRVIDAAGNYTLAAGVTVRGISGWHDDAQGAKRGSNTMFVLQAEGLKVVHMGDVGCELTPEQEEVLRNPDVLMIPVGGFYTIDAAQAKTIADRLSAKTVLPMHYRTGCNADWPIAPVEPFLSLYPNGEVVTGLHILRVTCGDVSCQPHVAVFAPYGSSSDGKAE